MKESSLNPERSSNKLFPMAHYINPRSYAGFTSTDCRKEPFSEKDKSMVAKFDLAYHALISMLGMVISYRVQVPNEP